MRGGVIACVVLLLTCVLMAGAVSAEEENVAKISDIEYATLYDAFNETVTGQQTVITLLRDATGGGAKLHSGNNTILDLNGHTFTIGDPTVGSSGTETNGFQLLKNSDITIKNGKITSGKARILIQNYANLTLDSVELNGTNLVGDTPYTLSNNFGNVVLKGTTKIIAHKNGVAFDVYYWPKNSYGDGVSVTIADSTVEIQGSVEFECDHTQEDNHKTKASLIIPYGYDLPLSTVCNTFAENGYSWKATGNGMMTLNHDSPISELNDSIVVSADGKTATLLRDVELTQTSEITTGLTLDLNGHTITNTANHALNVNGPDADLKLVSNTPATIKGKSGEIAQIFGAVNVRQGKLTVGPNVKIEGSYAGIQVCGSDSDTPSYSTVLIQNGATVQGNGYGVIVSGPDYKSNKGYGAVLDVSGTINGGTGSSSGGTVGIFVSGNMITDTGTNLPQIIIRDGATITGEHGSLGDVSSDDGQAIAGNGYAKIIIHGGTFSGDEALGVKSGEWEINGGTFTASGVYHDPAVAQGSGTDAAGAAVSVTTTYKGPISLIINGGTFKSTQGDALYLGKIVNKDANVKLLKILGGTFIGASGKNGINVVKNGDIDPFTFDATKQITGGKYSTAPEASYLPAGYGTISDNGYYTIAKEVPKPEAAVEKDSAGTVTKIDATNAVSGGTIAAPAQTQSAPSVTLELQANSQKTGDIITLTPVSGSTLSVDSSGVVTGPIAAAVIKPKVIEHAEGLKTNLELTTTNMDQLFGGSYELKITNEPKASDMGSKNPDIVAGISVALSGLDLSSATVAFEGIQAGSKTPQVWHAKNGQHTPVASTYSGTTLTFTTTGFSSYYVTLESSPQPVSSSSSSGNTENAFRVLFETKGGSFVQPATGLSYGDRITKPADPERDGYSFAGWYKDSAGTVAWVFGEDAVPGDTSLYAKWVPAGSAVTDTQKPTVKTTAIATAGSTVKQTAASTTAAATAATTAPAGISPTMTQAPAPLAGLLLGLLGGCVLLRRKE